MKKTLAYLLSICFIYLSGCGGIYSNFRELEHIRVVQTMGLDYIPGGAEVTLSSANVESKDKEALCLSGTGSSITDALYNIRNNSAQEDLFLSHVKQLLLGEKAARIGLEPYLAYICRSPDLRIDTPLFVVKDKTAKETMSGAGSGNKGISEIFEALETGENRQHSKRIISSAEIINNLDKYGGALLAMLEYIPAAENEESSDGKAEMTAALSGYGIIKASKLCGYIDSENALGADFLLNRLGITDIVISDREGRAISMELSSGSSSIEPVWENDELKALDIFIETRATLLEMQDAENFTEQELSDYLLTELEAYISDKVSYVLQLSRKLQCDFLGLSGIINMKSPTKFSSLSEGFIDLLPGLKMQVSVSAELCHTKDIKDGDT